MARRAHFTTFNTETSDMQNTATVTQSNRITFADLEAAAQQLGEEAGRGKDTQIKFLLKAVEGGYHNALDLSGNKHGLGVDDASRLSEIYWKAQQGAVVFDAKAANQRKTISTVRTAIKLGSSPKFGQGEPLSTVNDLLTMRQNLKKIPTEAKKLDDAANTLLKYARVQLKRDQLLADDELKALCYKKQADDKTVEGEIEAIAKRLDKLIDGSAGGGTMQANTQNIISARHSVRKELASIASARNPAPLKKSA